MAVRFIGGGNQSIRRKPPTCRKSLTPLSYSVVSVVSSSHYMNVSLQIG